MSEPLKHQPFLSLNANKVEKVRDGVVKRNAPDVPLSSGKIRQLFDQRKASTREKAQREPDRTLVDVSQPRQAPLPMPVAEPAESEPESVARKKTGPAKGHQRSPESIAKQKATLAKKKRGKKREPRTGEKKAFVLANPSVGVPELVKLAAKDGMKILPSYVYSLRSLGKKNGAAPRTPKKQPSSNGPSSNGASVGDLLETIASAAIEIKRRLSQLTL